MISVLIYVGKVLLTLLLTFFFGYDRQKAHKPIGFGTYIYVATGSCSLAIASHIIAPENPLPLLAAIISGIGFLGAGALIKTTDRVFGFSSAATIWLFAIFGLLIGVGEIFLALLLYVSVWIVVYFDNQLEAAGVGSYQKRILLHTNKIIPEKEIEHTLLVGRVKLKKLMIDVNKKENTMSILYQLEGRKDDINQIPQRLYTKEWFSQFKVE